MCAHIRQNRHIYRRVYTGYILTRTPSPFSAGSSWGLLSRKIFSNFIFFWFSLVHRMFGLRIIFLFFRFRYCTRFIVNLILVLYLSDFDLEFTSSRLRFSTLIIILDSVFFDYIFRLVFPRIDFDLFQHCLFNSLSL